MAIIISDYESYWYKRLWGESKDNYMLSGQGFTRPQDYSGNIKFIHDELVLDGTTWSTDDVALSSIFYEYGFIINVGVRIKVPSSVQSKLAINLYTDNTENATLIKSLQYNILTDAESATHNLADFHVVEPMSKGNALGFHNQTDGANITDGTFEITVMYSSGR